MAFSRIQNIEIAGLSAAIPNKKIAVKEQTASDLAYEAALNLIEKRDVNINEIGFILFLTKTPDYRTPNTAVILQGRLNLSEDSIVYDINIGNLGFISGLQIGCSILNSINKKYGLILVGDTCSKQLEENDQSNNLYADAASAILLMKNKNASVVCVDITTYSAGKDLFKMTGGFRTDGGYGSAKEIEKGRTLFDVGAFYEYIISEIPLQMVSFIKKCNAILEDYEYYVFHEENKSFLSGIKKCINVDEMKILTSFKNYDNTSGSSIPLSIIDRDYNRSDEEIRFLSCSYGEGLSMGFADFFINRHNIFPVVKTDNFFEDGSLIYDL